MESATYKAIKEEGRQEATERFRPSLASLCLEIVRLQLGSLPPEAEAIKALDWESLSRLSKRLVSEVSPEAVRAAMCDLE